MKNGIWIRVKIRKIYQNGNYEGETMKLINQHLIQG